MAWFEVNFRHRFADGFQLDVAFNASQGVTALVGPSGGGKSTILAAIAGVLRPDGGRIVLGGEVLFDSARRLSVRPERRSFGVVFQERLLFPHMSVRENLMFGIRRRVASKVDFARLVDMLELRDLLSRYPHTLSGGQRQRVALGRAVLRRPRLLLLDEPLTALDENVKQRILSYIKQTIVEYDLPTLLVSHNPADVAFLTNTIIHIRAGRVCTASKAGE